MAMRFDAFFEVAFSMRALQFSSLYQMHCLKPVEVGEAANVIERGLIGNQSDVELTPQPLQKALDPTSAAVSRWKNAEGGHQQHALARANAAEAKAE